MATKVDLSLPQVRDALERKIASVERSINNADNALIKEILQKDLAALQNAKNTLTETK